MSFYTNYKVDVKKLDPETWLGAMVERQQVPRSEFKRKHKEQYLAEKDFILKGYKRMNFEISTVFPSAFGSDITYTRPLDNYFSYWLYA
jgi:hypothetical protein